MLMQTGLEKNPKTVRHASTLMNVPEKVSSCVVTPLKTKVHVKILSAHINATVMPVTPKTMTENVMMMMNVWEITDATSKPNAIIPPVHGSVNVMTDGEVMVTSVSIKTSVNVMTDGEAMVTSVSIK